MCVGYNGAEFLDTNIVKLMKFETSITSYTWKYFYIDLIFNILGFFNPS